MNQLSRRAVLRSLGVAIVGGSAGCTSVPFLGDNSEHAPGALVVSNQHSLAHVVHVSVTVPASAESETVSSDAVNGLDGQIPVDAGETTVSPEFLTGAVMYTVKMWLGAAGAEIPPDATEHDTVVAANFSPDASAAPDARGSFLTAQITQTGMLSWHVTYVH
jgi:hypothetical protein